MNNMKILFPVYSISSGGAERTVAYLSSYLADKGHQVYIYSFLDDCFYDLNDKVKFASPHMFMFPDRPFNKWAPYFFYHRVINYLKRKYYIPLYLKIVNPDVVFCMLANMVPYFEGKGKRKYKIISSERANPLYEGKEEYLLRTSIFEKCDGVVFQTRRAANCYPTSIQNKAEIIANGVGNPDVNKVGEIGSRRKVFCAIGRLAEQKDYSTLLRAFKLFRNNHNDFSLEIFGIGGMKEVIEKEICELGLQKNVNLMGENPHAIAQCADASAYILSSIFEGMPNSLMEAMAVGLPCISTDCPFGPAELIHNGLNGLLVNVGDVNAMAKAMERYVNNPEFAEQCGREAKKVMKDYSIECQCGKFEKYINDVMKK